MQGIVDPNVGLGQGRSSPGALTGGSPRAGLIRVLAAAGTMGTLGPIAAVAYGEGLQPPTLSALRAGIGAAILAVLLLAGRQPSLRLGRLPRRDRTLFAVAIAVNGLMNLALFSAFGAMAVGLVMVFYYCYPALVAMLSAALGRDRLTGLRIAALAIAGGGIVLVLGSQLGPEAHATLDGVAFAAAAATCQALYLVVIRGGFDEVPTVQATSLVLGGGLLISGGAAFALYGTDVLGPWLGSPVAWFAIACAATVGALPKAWIIGGVRLIGSTPAAVAMLVEPLVAIVVSAVALGQQLTLLELVGGGAVLAAVVLVQLPTRVAGTRVAGTPSVAGTPG